MDVITDRGADVATPLRAAAASELHEDSASFALPPVDRRPAVQPVRASTTTTMTTAAEDASRVRRRSRSTGLRRVCRDHEPRGERLGG